MRARVEFTREKFDELTASLLENTIDLTRQTLDEAKKLGKGDISKLLLVGGSSYMPQVRARIESEFGLIPELHDPDQSVAKGAAIYAGNKQIQERFKQSIAALFPDVSGDAGTLSDEQMEQVVEEVVRSLPGATRSGVESALTVEIINVASKSFGVVAVNEKGEDEIVYLIKKNSQVPAEKQERFGTVEDNQETVLIRIIEASGGNLPDVEPLPPHEPDADPLPFPDHAKQIETATLAMPPGLPAQSPLVVRYFLSEDGGRLDVDAEESTGGNKIETKVVQVNALSEQQVEERRQATNAITVM